MSFIDKNKPAVIIEIGNDWLKIVEGQMTRTGFNIMKTSFKKLAQIKEPFSDDIVKLWDEIKFNKRNVIPYIPRHLITVRILELPSTNSAEIAGMINLQIGKQTPYSKEEIVFSYQIIESNREGYTKVMLAIAKRNIVNERLDLLHKLGIHPQKVTLSSEGVYHWFRTLHLSQMKTNNDEGIILVDVDSNYSDFMFFYKGKLAFTKNILIGANHFEGTEIDYQGKFIEELVHSKEICLEEWKGIKVAKVYFSGAISNLGQLPSTLSYRLEIPCETIDSTKEARINNNSVSISAVLGFLIRQQDTAFNLMPSERQIQKVMEEKRRDLTHIGVIASAIVSMLLLLVYSHIDRKNTELTQIKSRLAQLKADSSQVDKMRTAVTIMRERIDANGDCLNLLKDIYNVLPPKMFLTSIGIERKGLISLRGQAQTMSEVFRFINKLENMPNLKNVKNTYATTNKEDNSEYDTDFEITAVYNSQ